MRSILLLSLLLCSSVAAALELPIVYSRCPRTTASATVTAELTIAGAPQQVSRSLTGLDVYDVLPDVSNFLSGFNAPCDLIYRAANGIERVLYDCSSTSSAENACAALDPSVSFDGQRVAFAVFRGTLVGRNENIHPRVIHPDAENSNYTALPLPNRFLNASEAQLHVVNIGTGQVTALPFVSGEFDSGPAFLPNGRLLFTSTRDGNRSTIVFRTGSNGQRGVRLWSMDDDGRNVDLVSHHSLGQEQHPFVLRDGRVVYSSWQVGMAQPFRHTNGSIGGFTTLGNLFHLYTQNPDGAQPFAFYGQHSGDHATTTALGHDHKAAHFITQDGNGRVWFADYYRGNNNGLGHIVGVMPEPEGQEGIGPDENPLRGDLYAPRDAISLAAWSSSTDSMAKPMPPPAVNVPSYADPLPYAGKLGHPAALPQGRLLLAWGKGACSTVSSSQIFTALGRPVPPLTSGSGGGTAANVITSLNMDTPGCDLGIYFTDSIPSLHPGGLNLVVDRREWHELMAKPVVQYRDIHGINAPLLRPDAHTISAHDALPKGTPFGLLGAASIIDRETHPLNGIHFAGEHQFNSQGTDTIRYTADDLCGVRILAAAPNRGNRAYTEIANLAGERLSILGEFPVRKRDVQGNPLLDPSGDPDTSFLVRFPANTAYFMQAIDCHGRSLNTDQTWQQLRPGESKTCGGCHVHSKAPRNHFAATAAAAAGFQPWRLGEGQVPLLAGESAQQVQIRQVAGYGLQIDLQRDIMPIFQSRCVSCHGGTNPQAGLALDRPGTHGPGSQPASTWWCLVRDYTQQCVPESLRHTSSSGSTALRRPQVSRHLRAFNALGSLLYWKAANQRTDNVLDSDFSVADGNADYDIDFGLDHPTTINEEELGLLSRWIDLGAPGGSQELRDTTRPTLTVFADRQAGQLERLRIGSVDIGTGIDPDSLVVCLLDNGGNCQQSWPAQAMPHGVRAIDLSPPLSDPNREIEVTLSDLAGNTTRVRRSVGFLLEQTNPAEGNDVFEDGFE